MSNKEMDLGDWAERNIEKIQEKYNIKGYYCDSGARDDCWVFTRVEGRDVSSVGTDHIFNSNVEDDIRYVEKFIRKVHSENPSWE